MRLRLKSLRTACGAWLRRAGDLVVAFVASEYGD